ncbi:ester cyclase [Microbulbifer sp. OS29]|uniref:Ester cyclase n=1 Tax=Microbulbifer okhotskensis TaxID=2926617 RepID=A0A9X2EQW3_9GAMM|nr:ester cyclase [Microbulbifer okhotskensis]MCO1336161.1 ester cyclase [Microbulbifer okhotskensis]
MTSNKETSKALLELWADNVPQKSTDYLSPNYINHQIPDTSDSISTISVKECQDLVTEFHKCFADVNMEILLQVAEGDYVCTRWRVTATQTSNFLQYDATGKTSTWNGVHTDLYKDGKMIESWVDWDKFSFLEGLGLVK